ncbi:MAG TPA: toll/interleukin-1 receptor domain-containing protein [Bryobacteraceae bacterium]|jgi:hypothetical protein|nr:toll/interleukin-1 receptor domain-containing protein [Bryobacteraceae bacterium]
MVKQTVYGARSVLTVRLDWSLVGRPVFISYSRDASSTDAQALVARLGDLAFLDTGAIDDGDQFPQRLLDGILGSSVVVIFATKEYSDSRFCRLELRLALTGSDRQSSQVILARGDGWTRVRDILPTIITDRNWPTAKEPDRLETLVRDTLSLGLLPLVAAATSTIAADADNCEGSGDDPPQKG